MVLEKYINKPICSFSRRGFFKGYKIFRNKKINILNLDKVPKKSCIIFTKHTKEPISASYPHLITSILKTPTCFYNLKWLKEKKLSELAVLNGKFKDVLDFADNFFYKTKRKKAIDFFLSDFYYQIPVIPENCSDYPKLMKEMLSEANKRRDLGYNIGVAVDGPQHRTKEKVLPGPIELAAKTGLDVVVANVYESNENVVVNFDNPKNVGFKMPAEDSLSDSKYRNIRRTAMNKIKKRFEKVDLESELYLI